MMVSSVARELLVKHFGNMSVTDRMTLSEELIKGQWLRELDVNMFCPPGSITGLRNRDMRPIQEREFSGMSFVSYSYRLVEAAII